MAQQKRTWTAGIGQLLSRMGLQNRHAPIIAAMVAVAIIISGIAIAHVVVQPADQAAGITLEHKEDSSSAELQDGKEQVGDTDNSSSGQTVFVDVNGAVRKPSVYELKAGSRVIDAIDAAGGLTDDAESSSVNLARAVVDGEQIHIPSDKELAEASSQGTQAGASSAAASSSSPPSTSAPVPAQVPASSSGAPAASKASPSG